ncbi:MAG: winged helix DNA-binding domain-containing protein [Rhodospirillaceae bacterium]|nr:winged helix DNA-binding domain-containing protein [Rhodospirillaceae bacterium]
MSQDLARAFLLDRLGLRGAFWPAKEASARAVGLGMMQIDSIRSTGLRNHEIAWVARTDAPIAELYDVYYRDRLMLETHYPLFATRRDWVPFFLKDFGKAVNQDRLREMRPMMRKVKQHIAENGPISPADLDSERVIGGFNTIKATTRALEYLYHTGQVQISGRSKNFHRLFDLTERVAPELLTPMPDYRARHKEFFVHSALSVLKLATPQQLAERVSHHMGTWRGGGLPVARKLIEEALDHQLIDWIEALEGDTHHRYLALKSDLDHFRTSFQPQDETVRLVPPLDNLMFSRRRFTELFGFTYKFEAYTPEAQRRFYFAMPLLYRDKAVGLIDGKREGEEWRITGLDLHAPVPVEALRAAVHRFARIAGCSKVTGNRGIPKALRAGLVGKIDG